MKIEVCLILALAISYAAADSCASRCGDLLDNSYTCQCNVQCSTYNDCCSDYGALCNGETCNGQSCDIYDSNLPCQCNDLCSQYGNCCSDRDQYCSSSTTDSCAGLCGQSLDTSRSCQCNTNCIQYGDCCSDYSEQCDGGSTGGSCSPSAVTNAEIESISLEMWDSDVNTLPTDAITYNLQSKTTSGATNDVASQPFFSYVDETYLEGDTFQKLIALQDNYFKTQGQTEDVTAEELAEDDAFLDAVLGTAVGQKLYDFLDSKNLAGCNGLSGFKDILRAIWFGMYSRQATDDTSGFEHSFVGEIKGSKVSGFHSWVKFYHEEQAGNFNYQGYIAEQDPRMVAMRHTWYSKPKSYNGFTIGTSPEIEFALYSLCHLTKPDSLCGISLRDQYGSVVDRDIQTWTWTGSTPTEVNGQKYIASAYFST